MVGIGDKLSVEAANARWRSVNGRLSMHGAGLCGKRRVAPRLRQFACRLNPHREKNGDPTPFGSDRQFFVLWIKPYATIRLASTLPRARILTWKIENAENAGLVRISAAPHLE